MPPYKPYGIGACGEEPVNKDLFVAMNAGAYDGSCGLCAKVQYQGKCVVAPIVDKCPGCGGGSSGLDLSLHAFGQLVGGRDQAKFLGTVKVDFELVACPRNLASTGSKFFSDVDPCSGSAVSETPNAVSNVESAPAVETPQSTKIEEPKAEPTEAPQLTGTVSKSKHQCDSNETLFGFPCCKDPSKVGEEYTDKNGYRWGFEAGASCIVPKA